MKRVAFNDMLGKGWDSAAQESYCWQKFAEGGYSEEPGTSQFWWVPECFRIWGHAWDWDAHTRNDKGRYVSFPAGIGSGSSSRSSDSDDSGDSDDEKTTEATIAQRILCLATLFPVDQSDKAKQLIKIAGTLDDRYSVDL